MFGTGNSKLFLVQIVLLSMSSLSKKDQHNFGSLFDRFIRRKNDNSVFVCFVSSSFCWWRFFCIISQSVSNFSIEPFCKYSTCCLLLALCSFVIDEISDVKDFFNFYAQRINAENQFHSTSSSTKYTLLPYFLLSCYLYSCGREGNFWLTLYFV